MFITRYNISYISEHLPDTIKDFILSDHTSKMAMRYTVPNIKDFDRTTPWI